MTTRAISDHEYALATLAHLADALEAHDRTAPMPAGLADAILGAMRGACRTGAELIRAAE